MLVRLLLLLALFSGLGQAAGLTLTSPDGQLRLTVSDEDIGPHYQLHRQKQTVLAPSRLGLAFKKHGRFAENFLLVEEARQSNDTRWEQPWGERRVVRDRHNELLVTFKDEDKRWFRVRFRLFDDGMGFRYEVPEQPGLDRLAVTEELTEFVFEQPGRTDSWWIPSRGWNRYEYLYRQTPMSELDRVHTPVTFRLPQGEHVTLHEAALVDYAAMTLDQRRDGVLKANLTPWYDGIKVHTQAGFHSPWRTVQVGRKAIDLLNSDLILNLNEPNKLGDVSWVKPGKYIGIWWEMHLGTHTWGSGPQHGATTARTRQYMDFAARYGFDGVLVEGWNIGWDGSWFHNGDVFSFTQPYPDFDIEAVTEYGAGIGVKLIGHHETSGSVTNYRRQMEEAYDLYARLGVSQIKTGYVADGGDIKRVDEQGIVRQEWHDGQFMVGEYLHSVKEAAKRKISINTHEPVKDTGLRRTYPNWISREGARGQEFNAWGSPPNPPEHTVNLVYTRMLSGPMDFTPGIFNLAYEGLEAENRVQTTLAKQLALYVVLYSPIQMAADLPEHYLQRLDAFQFILDVPTDWEQSLAIAGEVGDYVVFARQQRGSQDWYLGAITDELAREIPVSLDFLPAGQVFEAQIYRDGENADWLTNPYDLVIERKSVRQGDKLTLELATSGGVAIRFKALRGDQ
ncbi:glycoside hydrolase family 97 protein [Bowmanella dokdonensis]|uniref:Glycoside hydrolase family 97 protein n=1 Tax=Bowmanella dokdonensis TaxID=751969 RepID=A0A939DRH6_9ALTE|nr:glycoside hydrolase family 97 protein [Bowmanella dokdonensis]MBN7826611.1 glycoside hydrolase family 97 protein [Bowmanella dokdonensis]